MNRTIDRRRLLKGLGLTAAALTAPQVVRAAKQTDKPNIIFILADDLGWSDVNCYGHRFHETPNIDRLAAGGMRFTDAYAACPVCSPTRASVMTGKYPARLGLTDWIPGMGNSNRRKLLMPPFTKRLPLEEVTIAEVLKAAGYRTGAVGKWHLGPKGFWPEDQGFDVNVAGNHTGTPAGGYFLPNRMTLKNMNKGDYLTDRLTSEGISFIKANTTRPFFLYQSYHSVHTPIQAKADYVKKYKAKASPDGQKYHATYAGMVQSLDEGVGRILKTLDEMDMARKTVVFFMSDNNGLRSLTAVRPLRAGKGHIYEGGIREPMIIRYPAMVKAASTCAVPVASVDFFPTMLELAGAGQTPAVDGESLVGLLKGGKALKRKAIFWHYPHYSPQGGRPASAVRMGDHKLIRLYEDNSIELYDLKADIGETTNLAARQPERTAEMTRLLDAWLKDTGAKFPKPNPAYNPKAPTRRKRAAAPAPVKLAKGTRDGEFDVLAAAAVNEAQLGYAVTTGDAGRALKKLDTPLTAKATFTLKLKSLMKGDSPRIYRNGFLAFGDGGSDTDLIKCGLYLGGQRKYAIIDGAVADGRLASKPMGGDPLRVFDVTVKIDLAAGTVAMSVDGQTLTLKLARQLKAVTHVGYFATRTTTGFSKVEVAGR